MRDFCFGGAAACIGTAIAAFASQALTWQGQVFSALVTAVFWTLMAALNWNKK